MKKLQYLFTVLALVFSHIMCIVTAYNYSAMLCAIEHAGASAPANTAFFTAIPFAAGVVLSGVGCVSRGRVRDAGGVNMVDIPEPMEIVSLMGTVSEKRCHLHVAFAKEDLSVIGGHLVRGCIINTTCELVIGVLESCVYDVEFDGETGYDELVVKQL